MICRDCTDFDGVICDKFGCMVRPDDKCRKPKPPVGAYKLRCALCGEEWYSDADVIVSLPGLVFEYDCPECRGTNRITLQHLLERG